MKRQGIVMVKVGGERERRLNETEILEIAIVANAAS